ncbi:glycosyltransferase [candidate division KSB1 bacterium]|nr:glycosyltransferase [candidate division KSB1 bacterium]
MNILFVNSSLVWGGNEKWTLRAAETLASRDHQVAIAIRNFEIWQGHERGWVDFLTLPFTNDADIFTVFKLRKLITEREIDILLPTRSRDYWLSGFARLGTSAKYVMRNGITRDLPNTLKERLRYGRFPDGIVVNAQAVKESLAKHAWVQRDRIHVIYNGVDSAESSEQVPPLKQPGEFLIVAAGRVESDKGFDVLVEAMALALRDVPSLRCVIFGRGDMEAAIQRRIDERQVGDSVRLGGFTTNLAAVLKQADLSVSSSYREGVSNFILESWSAGVPIIATSIPGSTEIIAAEQRGGLVLPGDAIALSSAILRAFHDRELCGRWSAAGTLAIQDTFNWTRMAEQLETLFIALTAA